MVSSKLVNTEDLTFQQIYSHLNRTNIFLSLPGIKPKCYVYCNESETRISIPTLSHSRTDADIVVRTRNIMRNILKQIAQIILKNETDLSWQRESLQDLAMKSYASFKISGLWFKDFTIIIPQLRFLAKDFMITLVFRIPRDYKKEIEQSFLQ